ncbi:NADPH:quinone reductase-like Zn-dependent oxidoreductase [Mucilaginibacter yixingensis]|uniref:NADPH:quinone reductase-like Zn-dependent oxidoreductase n=1 Tax=Mucilaginibacter yixingensis TaxID=1295612 RepID=A0A2T5JG80_9SPHI|nr:zinc-dependent alcohol dehydrogenase family protein [Mucilaginibacter yixingensis]PTR01437.1 NADPH:quinone reductase-like Zn-dependent oxidoreductase [Mucilaginibacter yixingensis]
MKALVLENFNTPYQLKEVAKPVASKGHVLVKIEASSVNPLDLKIKSGQAAHAKAILPGIMGIDMAGTVEAVGEGVTAFKPGDAVYGMTGGIAGVQGSLAQYAAVDADLLALKPANISMREAAAIPLVFITAWEGLVDRASVAPGKTVLVHGGAGGVGHIAVQIARALGAEVFATVDAAQNGLIESYGATPINYKTLSVEEYVEQYSSGEGFDIVFDTVGGATLDNSFKAAKQYTGHVISILGWGQHSLAPLSFRGATYSGVFTLYPLISGKGRKQHGNIMRQATRLIESDQLKPILDAENYTLDTVEDAYEAITQGKTKGKVVITVE